MQEAISGAQQGVLLLELLIKVCDCRVLAPLLSVSNTNLEHTQNIHFSLLENE